MIDIKRFREDKNISQKEMCAILGIAQPFLSDIERGKKSLPDDKMQILYNHYGDIILDYKNPDIIIEVRNNDTIQENIGKFEKNIGVPYFEDLDVTASVITSFQDYKEVPTFLINYKHFNDCDAYLPVVGDSMYPKYCAGELVAIKQILTIETILWGETYLVITNENANNLRTIKDVHYCKDESKLILRASNPDYAGDTYIKKTDIISMFIVKGRIRRNQL